MAFKKLLDQAKEGFIAKAPEEVQSQVFRHINRSLDFAAYGDVYSR
ncbi:hypothetical protein ACFSL6_02770 [Paenibacillus thailandensis]|uniref:Uncharacterized protein n=1 Tax=Paenibacillus thailandensis TaxID=393250 RepID=A0ABW5QX43_9BACL